MTPSPTASITVSNGQHTFQVRALNDTGTLLATNTVTATVANQTPPPPRTRPLRRSPATCASPSATATSVTIAWNAATDNVGVAGYDIYRGTSQRRLRHHRPPLRDQRAHLRNRISGRRRRARRAPATRRRRRRCRSRRPRAPTRQPPTAPSNVTASTRTTTSIALTWAPATDNVGVAGYGIYNGADLVDTTAGTTGIVSGLTCGTNYTLAVDAFDATGNSSPKTTIMVSTLPCTDTTPPTQPTNLRTTSATTTSVTLAWNAATDNVAVARLRHLPRRHQSRQRHHTTYTINGLTCGTTYSVGVRAVDTAGNTSPANNHLHHHLTLRTPSPRPARCPRTRTPRARVCRPGRRSRRAAV